MGRKKMRSKISKRLFLEFICHAETYYQKPQVNHQYQQIGKPKQFLQNQNIPNSARDI